MKNIHYYSKLFTGVLTDDPLQVLRLLPEPEVVTNELVERVRVQTQPDLRGEVPAFEAAAVQQASSCTHLQCGQKVNGNVSILHA